MREVSDVTAKPDQQDTNPMMILNNLEDVPQTVYRESRNRSMGVGPMRTRPIDRRIDTSPYSGPYLSPPPDTSWRRTNSDSALHHSAMQGMSDNRSESSGSRWNLNNTDHQHDGRPRSSCDVPRVPGIHIYPSAQEPGIVQIPIGNNTGSLPDLTSVHFPSPLHTPLDQEGDHSSSPYSSSPVSASPATLSPTSVPTGMRSPQSQGQFQFNHRNISHHHNSNHLSVPMNSRYLHHNKGVALENSITGMVDGINYSQNSVGIPGLQNMYTHCPSSSPSPTLQQPQQQQGSAPGYRSPMTRPSPQSSPGLGGRHSAPSSPAAPSPIPDYYLSHAQATLLQQHFEQFSMVDSPASASVTNVNYMDVPATSISHTTQTLPDVTSMVSGAGVDLNSGADNTTYYTTSPSSLVYQTAPPSLHTTPNTPTSIPDIILTDFSNTPDDLNRQEFTKELSNVINTALEADLFTSDASLREGLGALDFDGLQMLSDPDMNVISDSAEDHFRLDRL